MATRARAPAKDVRTKRTVDPKKVTNFDTWMKMYKGKYGNLVYDAGRLLVLDPDLYVTDYAAALADPVKTIEFRRAVDAYRVFEYPDTYPQLRVVADETMKALHEKQEKTVEIAKNLVDEAEKALLEATANWEKVEKSTDTERSAEGSYLSRAGLTEATPSSRAELAMEVAKHTRALEEAEAALNRAMYPIRKVQAESGLLRNALNFASQDTRKVPDDVYCIVLETSKQADRIVPFVSVASAATVAPVAPVAPVGPNNAPLSAMPQTDDKIVGTNIPTPTAIPPTKRRVTRKKTVVPAPVAPVAPVAPMAPVVPIVAAPTPVIPTPPMSEMRSELPAAPTAPKMLRILT